MDKYKKLFSNTIVFAIGTFSSKLLTIMLMPFITRALSTGEYGKVDLIQQTVNVLVPLATLAINSAALRFAMDRAVDKRAVFTTGVYTTGIGFAVFLCFSPLLAGLELNDVEIGNYTILIIVFLLSSSTRQLCQQFVRGMGWVRLYAIDGILATFTNLAFTITFLGFFQWGIEGAILSIVASDVISIIFLTFLGKLYRFIKPKRLHWSTASAMLKYCVPLVPTAILWLIINISDRYMVTYFHGVDANGLYAAASKIPNFVLLFAGIFIDAWQLSAVDEYDNANKGHFFTKIFKVYSGALFAVGSVLIVMCQLFTKILVSPKFYVSWEYVPILIVSTVFSCLVNFLASVYMAEKKSTMSMVTAIAGALINVGMNLLLIPTMGPNGAALATAISFVLVFILRAWDTKRFVHINFSVPQMLLNSVLLSTQCALMIYLGKDSTKGVLLYTLQGVIVLAMFLINGKPLFEIARLLLTKVTRKKPVLNKKEEHPPIKQRRADIANQLGDSGLQHPQRRHSAETAFPTHGGLDTFDMFGIGTDFSKMDADGKTTQIKDVPDIEPPKINYSDAFQGEYTPMGFDSFQTKKPTTAPNLDDKKYDKKVTEYSDDADETYFDRNQEDYFHNPQHRYGHKPSDKDGRS